MQELDRKCILSSFPHHVFQHSLSLKGWVSQYIPQNYHFTSRYVSRCITFYCFVPRLLCEFPSLFKYQLFLPVQYVQECQCLSLKRNSQLDYGNSLYCFELRPALSQFTFFTYRHLLYVPFSTLLLSPLLVVLQSVSKHASQKAKHICVYREIF